MIRRSAPGRITPITPWPTDGTLDAWIRAERVRVVFRQALPAQLLAIVAGGVVCYALWDVADRDRLVGWLIAVTAVTVGRMGLSLAFRRADPSADRMRGWEQAFLATLAVVTLVWGVGGWFIMPPDSLVHQGIVYFFLMGVAGGAVSSYSAHPGATAVAIITIMLPATVSFALEPVMELRAMAAGGTLYLAAALRSTRSFGYFMQRNFQLSFELHEAYARAKDLSRTDDLTGLPNRRAFVEHGATAVELARRHERACALVMFDVDHFKAINDTNGHAAGDLVLKEVAAAVWHVARTSDTPGRLGGEEFALLLPETSAGDAVTVAERLRAELGRRPIVFEGVSITFTCSFGVAARAMPADDLDTLLRRADQALYRAKADGRNCVRRND